MTLTEIIKQIKEHGHHISETDLRDIWGNYYRSYQDNNKLFYTDDSKEGRLITEEGNKFKAQDDIIERLDWYLDTLIPNDVIEILER